MLPLGGNIINGQVVVIKLHFLDLLAASNVSLPPQFRGRGKYEII